jgi:hypothetical protein
MKTLKIVFTNIQKLMLTYLNHFFSTVMRQNVKQGISGRFLVMTFQKRRSVFLGRVVGTPTNQVDLAFESNLKLKRNIFEFDRFLSFGMV